MTTDKPLSVSSFQVCPYRFTDQPEQLRDFFQDVGLRPVIGRSGFTVMRGSGGLLGIHPLATAESTDRVSTGFGLEADDARRAAEDLQAAGLEARWWDESWGRQAAVHGPQGEIMINEPLRDTYGYEQASAEAATDVEVVGILFSPDLDDWSAFFARLGFTGDADPGWRELRASAGSGAIGLHIAEAPTIPVASGLSFTVRESLPEFADRMRALGHQIDDVPDAEAPHVEVLDPDGIRLEVHHRPHPV